MRFSLNLLLLIFLSLASSQAIQAQQTSQITAGQRHFMRANQKTGLLIPLYLYPENVHTNDTYNRLIKLKLEHPTVPVCVIVNPASGPGTAADGNHKYAIKRLRGSGCTVLGYVSTQYAKLPLKKVTAEIQTWTTLYEGVDGIFLDEQSNQDDLEHIAYYKKATHIAHEAGLWPVVANPGTGQIEKYFSEPTADVIVTHEDDHYPSEETLRGDYFGGYADYPPYQRSTLIYSQPAFDAAAFHRICKYTRWVYVTDDTYISGAPADSPDTNPWDSLSKHLEEMFAALEKQ